MYYFLCALAVLLASTFIVVRVLKGGFYALFTKSLASVAFVAMGLVGAYYSGLTKVSFFLILGLLAGLLGDIVLDLKVMYKEHEKQYLNTGILCFSLGHIMYFISALSFADKYLFKFDRSIFLIMIALGIAGLITIFIINYAEPLFKLKFGEYKFQVVVYTAILAFMSAFSICIATYKPIFLLFAFGMLLIFASDLILSMQYFGENKRNNKLLTILNHALYYAGQILIASLLFFI